MIRQYELIEKIRSYNPDADVALINRAYVFSMKAHGNQKRASGQPYLVHPLAVASLLADLKLDDATIVTGLLHDTVEDTLATIEQIEELFGEEVAKLTDGVTKLSQITFNSKLAQQAENYRKLFLAMSQDIRVLLVKLNDRLHNIQTLDAIPKPEKRLRIARETMDIFVPLADRIGLHGVKGELEDRCFRVINPDEYARIEDRMAEWREQDNLVERVVDTLADDLQESKIPGKISGREKAIYSIYRKMSRKNLLFEQLTDIVAYRIVVETRQQCYEVLGMMHDRYKAIPGRFKDYISNPKPNGYQSLHTSVIGPFGNRMEVQIRTQEMHDVAESGVAAHWLYKQSGSNKQSEEQRYAWLRQMVETLQGMDDPEEFIEHAKLELFTDQVYVFTPNGDLIALPKGATALDFAYFIHSDVGNSCQTVRVNGRMVPLRTQIRNGDQVEVQTNKAQKPTPGWRSWVVSARAKGAINRYLRLQSRDEEERLGKEILEKSAKREEHSITEKMITSVVDKVGYKNLEDLYVGIAQGRAFPRQIFDILFPPEREPQTFEEGAELRQPATAQQERKPDSAIGIQGLTEGISIHFAKCCNPLPGDPIVGIIHTGKGVTIHTKDCRSLEQFADVPERWLTLSWNEGDDALESRTFQANLRVILKHEPGALSAFTTTLFNAGANVIDIGFDTRAADHYVMRCIVEVHDRPHLEQVLGKTRSHDLVLDVERLNS